MMKTMVIFFVCSTSAVRANGSVDESYVAKTEHRQVQLTAGFAQVRPAQIYVPEDCKAPFDTLAKGLQRSYASYDTPAQLAATAYLPFQTALEPWLPRRRLEPWLPRRRNITILDIGCGFGLYNIFVSHFYHHRASFFLMDRSADESKDKGHANTIKYHGKRDEFAFYNNLACAADTIAFNGVPRANIHTVQIRPGVDNENLAKDLNTQVDVAYSLISWGFHYPVSTYAALVGRVVRPNGRLILTVRRGHEQEAIREFQMQGFEMLTVSRDDASHNRSSSLYVGVKQH